MPLRRRLFFAITATVLAALALALIAGGALVRRQLDTNQSADLGRELSVLAQPSVTAPASLASTKAALRREGITLVTTTVAGADAYIPASAAGDLARGQAVSGTTGPRAHRVLYAAQPSGGQVLVVTRAASLPRSIWRPFLRIFFWSALIGAGLAALAAWLVSRRIADPISRVADASRRLAAGERPEPVPETGARELVTLGTSFNHMATELDRARSAERDFLLSVSHELKTPLTALRGYGEALTDGTVPAADAGAVIGRESARLERLVGDLLELGRTHHADFSVRSEPVALAGAVQEVTDAYRARAAEQRVTLAAHTDAAGQALADPDRVTQVLSNLVENALRVSDPGGTVTITATGATASVTDDGPGIKAEDIPRAFERFYLHDRYSGEHKTGTGLGLAIVQQLTRAMGGTVTVESTPGQGASFTVSLPAP
jgi:two-component system sensor histidine kinase BaeS